MGPRALNIDLDMRSAWTLTDWGGFARRHYGPDATVVARASPEPETDLRLDLPELAAHLSTEDLGDIPPATAQALDPATIAREAEDLREAFEERAGILEYDAGLPRPEAELDAARITATYARNRGYAWASMRAALADYPALLAQVPATSGTVDSLPLGVATVAVLKGGRVVKQGTFAGESEVKT